MLGYAVGSFAGSPYERFNTFTEDVSLFSPRRVSALRSVQFRENRWYRDREYLVHDNGDLAYSAATMRFLMDTLNNRDRRDAAGFSRSLSVFEDDFGELPEFSESRLPAAVMPLAFGAANREEALRLVGVVAEEYLGGDRNAVERVLPALNAYVDMVCCLREGKSLEEVCTFIYSEYPEVELSFPEGILRSSANAEGRTWTSDLLVDDDKDNLQVMPDRDVFRSVCAGLKAAVESSSFGEALRRGISFGGESSVVAGVAGSVAQLIHSHPQDRKEADDLTVEAQDYIGRTYTKIVNAFDTLVGDPSLSRQNLIELRSRDAKEKGKDVVDVRAADKEYAAMHRAESEYAFGEGEDVGMDAGEERMSFREQKAFRFDEVKVLRLGQLPNLRTYYLPGKEEYMSSRASLGLETDKLEARYDDLVSRMKARFGEEAVIVGGNPEADYAQAMASWAQRKGTFLTTPECEKPQLLTRFFVPDMKLNSRTSKGDLVTVFKDSVVPVWQLLRVYYDTDKRFIGDVVGARKEFKTFENARAEVDRLRAVPREERDSVEQMRAEMASLVLSKEKYGGWATFVRKSFTECGTSEHAKYLERTYMKRYSSEKRSMESMAARLGDKFDPAPYEARMKDALKKGMEYKDMHLALDMAEKYIPSRRVLINAFESQRCMMDIKKGIHEGFVSMFDDEADVYESIHGSAYSDTNSKRISDVKEPKWYESLADGFNIYCGDIVTGSVEISPKTGRFVYNENVERGVVNQAGRIIVPPIDQEPTNWVLNTVKRTLFDDRSFEENVALNEAIEDSKRGGPYEVKVDDNIGLLNGMLARSSDQVLQDTLDSIAAERARKEALKDSLAGRKLK